jgi:hypothetical protein
MGSLSPEITLRHHSFAFELFIDRLAYAGLVDPVRIVQNGGGDAVMLPGCLFMTQQAWLN